MSFGLCLRPVRTFGIPGNAPGGRALERRPILLLATGRTAGRNRRFRACRGNRQTGKSLLVDRAAKKELVTTLNGVFKGTNVVVVAQNSGLTVAQMQHLRKQMKQAGGAVKVTKNR